MPDESFHRLRIRLPGIAVALNVGQYGQGLHKGIHILSNRCSVFQLPHQGIEGSGDPG